MEIRRLRASDGAQLREVRLRALADAPYAFSSSLALEREHGAEFWAHGAAESDLGVSGVVFAAVEAEETIGMAGGFSGSQAGDSATLWGMWVDPKQRGRGVGRRLVEAVAGWARDAGAHHLRLAVTDCEPSEPAAALYRELGFTPTGEQERLESDPSLITLLMTRLL